MCFRASHELLPRRLKNSRKAKLFADRTFSQLAYGKSFHITEEFTPRNLHRFGNLAGNGNADLNAAALEETGESAVNLSLLGEARWIHTFWKDTSHGQRRKSSRSQTQHTSAGATSATQTQNMNRSLSCNLKLVKLNIPTHGTGRTCLAEFNLCRLTSRPATRYASKSAFISIPLLKKYVGHGQQ